MQNVIVIRNHVYAGVRRTEGTIYQALDRDIPILRRMGYVELDRKAVVKKPLPAAEPIPSPAPDEKPQGKRKERRRKRRDRKARE